LLLNSSFSLFEFTMLASWINVDEDDCSIGGFDDALEIRVIVAISSSPRMIRASKLALDPAFTGALG
jgi:hypothetical protein